MNKPQVLGKFLYVDLPQEKQDNKIIVDENTKAELAVKMLRKLQKLDIWAVGDAANPKLHDAMIEGKQVLVKPTAFAESNMVPFYEDGPDKEPVMRALILDYDVIHIWS